MLRLTEVKLPLDHPADALRGAVLERLGIPEADLVSVTVFRRAWDARRKSAIQLIYTVDVEVQNEGDMLARHTGDRHLTRAPDMSYRPVARAPAGLLSRPIVIGTGPCGLLAALILVSSCFVADVRDRTNQRSRI